MCIQFNKKTSQLKFEIYALIYMEIHVLSDTVVFLVINQNSKT